MALAGVDYLPREEFGPLQRRYSNPGHWRRRLWSPPLAYQFRRQLEVLRSGADTVLISDEDLLGYSDDQLSPTLYPAFRGEHIIKALSQTAPLKLFLGIRSYDKILPSAYAQMLKTFPPETEWRARITQEVVRDLPSWSVLIDRLLAAFPGASLQVWKYEDYREHWQGILTVFAGRDVGAFPDLPPPERTTSPSDEAIKAAEQLDRGLSVSARRAQVKRIYYEDLPVGSGRAPYRPYPDETVAILQDQYARDIQDIERKYSSLLIRPAGGPSS